MKPSTVVYIKKKDQNWILIRKNAQRAIKAFERQADAIKYGRAFAKKHQLKLSIYKADGKLKDSISYKDKKSSTTPKTGSPSKPKTSKTPKPTTTLHSELKKLFKKTGGSPISKPPTDKAIKVVEQKVDFSFSSEYKSFLKAGGTGIDSRVELFALEELAKETKQARKWIQHSQAFVPIAYDNGDYFCLLANGKIGHWYHDSRRIEKEWTSMRTFLKSFLSKQLITD